MQARSGLKRAAAPRAPTGLVPSCSLLPALPACSLASTSEAGNEPGSTPAGVQACCCCHHACHEGCKGAGGVIGSPFNQKTLNPKHVHLALSGGR